MGRIALCAIHLVLLHLLLLVGLSLPMPIRVEVNPPASSGTHPVKVDNVLEAYRQYLKTISYKFERCVATSSCHNMDDNTDDIDVQIRAIGTLDDDIEFDGYLDKLFDDFDAYLIMRDLNSAYFNEFNDDEDGFEAYLEHYALH